MKEKDEDMSIYEAVETLASIAELDPVKEQEIRHELMVDGQTIGDRKVDWLATGDDGSETVGLVKQTFKTVLDYLHNKYRDEDPYLMETQTLEGIKTIMLLVGEAAKKLSHFSSLFEKYGGSPLNMKEYQALQDFYMRKIDPTIDEEKLGKWILGIGRLPFPEKSVETEVKRAVTLNPQHLFVDLETVRSDSDYELFFVRKDDGSRFFNPRLIRSMKLVADFGFQPSAKEPLPFLVVPQWLDLGAHVGAKIILNQLGATLDFFLMEKSKFKERELVKILNSCAVALLLASHSRYLWSNQPRKCCLDYYRDFLEFYRQAIHSYEYQKLISYPPTNQNRLGRLIMNFVQAIARAIYFDLPGVLLAKPLVNRLVEQGYDTDELLNEAQLTTSQAETLWMDYLALTNTLKKYANNPLTKVLDQLATSAYTGFDPIFQDNLPNECGRLDYDDHSVTMLRLPTPTQQQFVNKPELNEEFKTLFRGMKKDEHLLIINYQNRTSWKEHDRSLLLEDVQNHDEYKGKLEVVTLEVDTEFYEQLAPHDEINDAKDFVEHFKEHLVNNQSGTHYSDEVEDQLFPLFVDEAIEEVHSLFFGHKNRLTKSERRSFIDLVHLWIEWKLIDVIHPNYVAFSCKDGVDISTVQYALFWYAFYPMNNRVWGQKEREWFNTIVLSPALLVRERGVQPDRIDRLIQTMKVIEEAALQIGEEKFAKEVKKKFGRMFHNPVYEGMWIMPSI